jgi:hypothetical protein
MSYERILLIVVAACVLRPAESRAAEPSDVWSSVDPTRVCAVASVWHLGVGARRVPNEMIETAVPMEVDGRAVWRVMHTMLRGAEDARGGATPGSDVYDLERATLAPLQSEHRVKGTADKPGNVTRFDYRAPDGGVLRLNADGSTAERIAVAPARRVLADGPGAAVLDQAIRWSDGLKLRAHVIDRWRGRENERLRTVEIAVTGRASTEIAGRRVEVFVVEERSLDGSFHMVSLVTTERPHRRARVEYYAGGRKEGARPFVSEVKSLMQDASCESQAVGVRSK